MQERRLQLHHCERHRHQQAAAFGGGEREFHQLLEGAHIRSAELVDRPGLGFAVNRFGDRFSDVAGKHRLKPHMAAAGERQHRRNARERGKAVEELVFRTEDDRRPHDDGFGLRRQDQPLACGLRARIVRGRVLVGADGRDMDEPRADGAGGAGHRFRAFRLDGIEALAAFFEQNADQIDDDVGIAHCCLDRLRVAQIRLHGFDLPDPTERPQITGQLRTAHRDTDAEVALGERTHHVAADEARAAEHGDQRVKIAFHSCIEAKHARLTRG